MVDIISDIKVRSDSYVTVILGYRYVASARCNS